MAADMHIHIFEGLTEDELALFFSNSLGSKWYNPNLIQTKAWWEKKLDIMRKIERTPNIWIGEVSWLKAAVFDDAETYIPDTVERIREIIGDDLPVIDDELIQKIVEAFSLSNKTHYCLAHVQEVKEFLEKYKGKRIFTVSW